MDLNLRSRSALVTGSTSGIGYAIANTGRTRRHRFHQRPQRRASRRRDCAAEGRGRRRLVRERGYRRRHARGHRSGGGAPARRRYPRYNTGIFEPEPFFEIPDEDWQRFFNVNVMSRVRLSRAYAPSTVERGWGRSVFIASESAIYVPLEMIHYGMTKTAQLSVSRGLAETVAGSGVTVNAVLPGPTLTEGVADFLNAMGGTGTDLDQVGRDFIAKDRPTSLIRRLASPEEVANMVA